MGLRADVFRGLLAERLSSERELKERPEPLVKERFGPRADAERLDVLLAPPERGDRLELAPGRDDFPKADLLAARPPIFPIGF